MGKGKFRPPPRRRIENLLPINKKFGKIDYVVDICSYAKFDENRSSGGFCEKCEIYDDFELDYSGSRDVIGHVTI